eukprot:392740-Pyramimonas_sp.AAC.1
MIRAMLAHVHKALNSRTRGAWGDRGKADTGDDGRKRRQRRIVRGQVRTVRSGGRHDEAREGH